MNVRNRPYSDKNGAALRNGNVIKTVPAYFGASGRGRPRSVTCEVSVSRKRLLRVLASLALVPPLITVPAVMPAAAAWPGLRQDAHELTLTTGAYSIVIGKSPFSITTERAGRTVLATAKSGALDFTGPRGRTARPTTVREIAWKDGVLDLTVATTERRAVLRVKIRPDAGRYRLEASVQGVKATRTGLHFDAYLLRQALPNLFAISLSTEAGRRNHVQTPHIEK